MCIGCPSGWECCGRAWGKCICKRPRWDSCCERVKDPACITASANIAGFSLKGISKSIGKGISKGIGKVGDTAKGISKDIGDTAKGISKDIGDTAKGISKDIGDTAKDISKGISDPLKKSLARALQGAKKVVDTSRHSLDVAKGILSAAQGALDAAKAPLDLANKALDVVKATYKAGVSALSALAKFALTKIIAITEMYFKVGLRVANGGKFQCRVKGVLMGKSFEEQLYFDTKNIFVIAKSLGEKAISGISKFIG